MDTDVAVKQDKEKDTKWTKMVSDMEIKKYYS